MIYVLVLLAILPTYLSQQFTYDGDVMVLNDGNFNAAVKKFDYILVEFYAQWCGHCKAFAPEYAKFATIAKEKQLNFVVAKLDSGGSEKATSSKYKVESFPTVILMIKGYALPYKGERDSDSLMTFMNSALSDRLKKLNDIDEVYKFIQDNNLAAVYFGSNQDDIKAYEMTAKIYPQVRFAYTDLAYARKMYDVDEQQIILFRTFEERRKEFTDTVTVPKLADFISDNITPSIQELDSSTFGSIIREGKPALILFYNLYSDNAKDALKILAPHIKNRIAVLTVSADNSQLQNVISHFKTYNIDYPQLYYQKMSGLLYKFDGQINQVDVMRFVYKANKGLISKKQKSQPIPNQTKQLLNIVGDTFQQFVVQSEQDVLVQFCQVSDNKCFLPEFEDFADQLGNVLNLRIGVIDMNENEVEGVSIETYPSIRLFKRNLKLNPIEFKEEFSIKNVQSFLKSNLDYWNEVPVEL